MFDNLIARAIVPVTIAVTGFVVFGCLLLYSFIKSDMTEEAVRHVDDLVVTVYKSTHYAMMEDDRDSLRNILANVDTLEAVERVRIYDQSGDPKYADLEQPVSDTSFAPLVDDWSRSLMGSNQPERDKVRFNVNHDDGFIAVTMPILNEPKCSTAACHFHTENEPILGFLSIGISSENLEDTLSLLRSRMVAFSVMVLFLTVGGVAALLRVNLFQPILRLAYNLGQAVSGVTEAELPPADHKLGQINKDFRALVKQRDQAWQDLQTLNAPDGEVNERTDEAAAGRRDFSGHKSAPQTGSEQD